MYLQWRAQGYKGGAAAPHFFLWLMVGWWDLAGKFNNIFRAYV